MKCGYVAVLGLPNAGKSSLVNRLVGEEVAIVSKRIQTTRNNILGICNGKNFQVVFIDTPGIHHSKNKLDRFMMKNVRNAITTADVILYLVDSGKIVSDEEKDYIKMLKSKAEKVIVVLTKSDKKAVADVSGDISISVKENKNLDKLINLIVEKLPTGDAIFDEDEYTDKSIKFLVCEHIRGRLLDILDNEIPHGIAVVCEKLEENESVKMDILIILEKERHKGIVIGKGGKNLKEIGISARQYAENLFGKKVNIQLLVKVDENWRNNNISEYGY